MQSRSDELSVLQRERIKGMERRYGLSWFYEEWMQKEGIPVHVGMAGVEDVTELPRRPWARLGGSGTFIQLEGAKLGGGLHYVVEIPAGGALEPEKHLYDELIYILRGRGLTEVWQVGGSKRSFEWGEGSLFALPLNAWHRLVNGGRQPALCFAATNAPVAMETFHNTEFIFNCDYNFTDRYKGQADYFLASAEERYKVGVRTTWETNFIPDVRTVFLDDMFEKAEGGQITFFNMAGWVWNHASEWPVGRYHKAHCHGPGAVLFGLNSVGYALVWPERYGPHPYQDGHGDKVVKVDWKPSGVYTSGAGPGEWFHQHFNTGPEPARHMTFGAGGSRFAERGRRDSSVDAGHISIRDGGRLIEYEDEDPEIRRMFQEELRQRGVEFTMKPVIYRTDPFKFSLL